MSFTLQLTPDLISVEPGASVPISITVENRGDAKDRFELEVEGIDPEWKAVPVPVFEADAKSSRTERVFFKPPRASESAAGDYPYVVRVRSLVTGDSQTSQGVLQVKPFHHLSMDVSPKRGMLSPMRREESFEVTLVNLGNTEHTIRMLASDPEDECAYEFEHDQVVVGPGAQRQVEMSVSPKRTSLIASGRLVGVNVSGRSVDTPAVMATGQTQIEIRPLFSPAALAGIALVAIVFFGWLLARPKPCTVAVSANPMSLMAGDTMTVQVVAKEADRVQVSVVGGPTLYDGPSLTGSYNYKPPTEGTVTIVAKAGRDNRLEVEDSKTITVTAAPVVGSPTIDRLIAEPTHVKLGEPFVLKYKFGPYVTQATLAPDNKDLNLQLPEQLVIPVNEGKNQYTVVVVNAKGETARRTITVEATAESDAHILAFDVAPLQVGPDNPHVKLSWQVTNAARIELKSGADPGVSVLPTDTSDVTLTGTTTFVLTAIDANDRKTSRKVTVTFVAPPPPTNTTSSTTGPAEATTGGVGTTANPEPGTPPQTPPVTTGTTGGQR